MLYLLLSLIVILEAVEDGHWERSYKTWSKRSEGLYKVLLLLIPVFLTIDILTTHSTWDTMKYMFTIGLLWASIRAYLFDPMMHLISGFKQDHPGITSPLWDRIMKRLPGWKTWVWRGFWLGFSVFWYVVAVK